MNEQPYADALPSQYRLHWYVLERVLGQGGFGITYLARDTNLDQPVAIKEYLPVDVATRRSDSTVRSRTEDQADRYRWGLDRFIREARTLARFDHPNIVRVLSVFEINNTAYMVMRFEEGENFAALLERRRTLPEEELRRVVLPILGGLELVHGAGFIHRDIKPDNIHIRSDGSPVLLDFGSARLAHGRSRTVTILVAPGYAPFEQYHSSGENQGPWTDIYGLGATCYRAIAGIEPMDAITRSRTELYQDKRDALVPAVNIGAGRYSPGLLRAVDHALAFSETDRPQTIAEWRKELTEPPRTGAPSSPETPADARLSSPAAPRAGALRGPIVWSTLGAVVAATIVVLLLRQATDPRAAPPAKPEPTVRQAPPPSPSIIVSPASPALPRASEADIAAREAERKRREELEAKLAALEARVQQESDARRKAEAERLRDAERARLEAEKRKQAEAQARRQEEARKLALARAEEARRNDEARKAEEARAAEEARLAQEKVRAAAAAAKKSAPKPVPGADTLALAEEAGQRGDELERYELLRKAAAAGHPRALLALGQAYATGRGVRQNNFQAYVYLRRAEIAGEADATPVLAQVKGKLQPAELEHAERLLR